MSSDLTQKHDIDILLVGTSVVDLCCDQEVKSDSRVGSQTSCFIE